MYYVHYNQNYFFNELFACRGVLTTVHDLIGEK